MKIAAALAGLGVAVGTVLLLALRFVVGPSVLAGVGSPVVGLPRRFVDYLPTRAGGSFPLRVLVVVLGTGLVAGLLIGVLGRLVRRVAGGGPRVLVAALVAAGLVLGTLLAVVLHVYGDRHAGTSDFGWYASSPLSRGRVVHGDGVFYGDGSRSSWWPLALTGATVGLLVGVVVAGGSVAAARLRSRRA